MDNGRLRRIAADWQARDEAGEMPTALYEALSEGSAGAYETKVIRSLAKISQIIDDDGTIRTFAVFKHDWRYSHSTYGKTHKCGICGQSPIVENCVLIDDERGEEVIVGNKCVMRYIEIVDPITGKVLTDEEREAFLKVEARSAKDQYTRELWMKQCPTVLRDLTEYEEFMVSDRKLKQLHRAITKRMVTHGYPGPKARRDWKRFIKTAPATQEYWRKEQAIFRREQDRRLAEEVKRKDLFAKQIAENRRSWGHTADDWLETTKNLPLNRWEANQRLKVASQLRAGTNLSEGNLRFTAEIQIRVRLDGGDVVCDDEDFMLLQRLLGSGKLSAWEESFARSVMGRIAAGSPLTQSQQEIVGKLRIKERNLNVPTP